MASGAPLPWPLVLALLLLSHVCACSERAARTAPDEASGGSPAESAGWPMPNPESAGLANPQRYSPRDDGAVLDEVTGLMWQRSVDVGPGEGGGFVWPAAVSHCDALSLAGFEDWRLPTRLELVSLVDFTRSEPAIDPVAFPDTPTTWTWSSSLAKDPTNFAWYVNFFFGYTNTNDRVYSEQVRCVRTADIVFSQSGARFELGTELVRDSRSGLTWQRGVSPERLSAAAADAYCQGLRLGNESGFRLPSMKELQTLVDERRLDPAIDGDAFPSTPSEQFWTSSRWADGADQAWFVLFYDGYALYTDASTEYRARCVR